MFGPTRGFSPVVSSGRICTMVHRITIRLRWLQLNILLPSCCTWIACWTWMILVSTRHLSPWKTALVIWVFNVLSETSQEIKVSAWKSANDSPISLMVFNPLAFTSGSILWSQRRILRGPMIVSVGNGVVEAFNTDCPTVGGGWGWGRGNSTPY